jgi:hypothetical protein
VFFEKKRVRIVHRKNDNPLILPLAETAIKAIAAYLVGARPKAGSRRLFLTLTVPFRPISTLAPTRRSCSWPAAACGSKSLCG